MNVCVFQALFCLLTTSFVSLIPVFVDEDEDYTIEEQITHSNEFVDDVLNAIRKHYSSKFDPFSVPDQRTNFEYRLINLRFKGNARLYNGLIHGLTSLRRSGDCLVGPNEETEQYNAKVRLGGDDLKYTSNIEFDLLRSRRSGQLLVTANHFDVEVNATLRSKKKRPVVDSVKIVRLEELKVKFKHIGFFLEPILNVITKVVLLMFKNNVKENIENNAVQLFNDLLAKDNIKFF